MGKRVVFLLCICLLAAVAAAQDLYEILGVKASATPAQMKKACVFDSNLSSCYEILLSGIRGLTS